MKKFSAVAFARFSVVALIVLALAITLPAQIQTGQFQGTVLDQSGAAVPNATITATNTATGQSFTAHSSGSGFYTLNQLPAATYNIKATAQGFKATESKASVLNAGMIEALNFKLTVGEVTQTVEVTSAAPLVQTDDPKLSSTVGAQQIANLPLNGRNVYDLIQMSPGAANVKGVLTENGARTVVNGVREDFNGFTINGVSNKGLSGGNDNQPIADTVQEFQELTLNNSAQYGNSAGSITNLVTKSGTNSWHGDAYEFVRNDVLDANNFFINKNRCDGGVAAGCPLHNNPELRFNQFGGTFGGPLIKDKLFFFAGYQGDRFITNAPPTVTTIESAAYRSAAAAANPGLVSSLLYSNFAPQAPTSGGVTINDYINSEVAGAGDLPFTSISDYLCPATLENIGGPGQGISPSVAPIIAQRLANVFGVTAAEAAACPGGPGVTAGTFNRALPFMQSITATFKQQTQVQGNLFNGNEGYLRLDLNASQNDRLFASMNWQKQTDQFGPGLPQSVRGFLNPQKVLFPNFQFNYVHTFTPNVLNEFRAGYTGNINLIGTGLPGVPAIGYDTGDVGFGSYNGYPQFFKENVYTYSDMVTVNHGNHNMKVGVDIRRNIENSEFNVARPSYYFFDPLFFTADAPYHEVAGVDPGIANGSNISNLQSNVRHWRNIEFGTYFQDDWKATRKLTLNLGLRYDLYTRHVEENNLETQFIFGPGSNIVDQVANSNVPAGTPGCNTPTQIATAQLAGVCGPGGFARASSLGSGDHNNFGPRLGFAYDVFGNGKTSLRGGVGVSYEGTLYNPLSNSRWNLPFYSFDAVDENSLLNISGGSSPGTVVYGPCQTPATPCAIAPSFTGPAAPGNNEGTIGAQATGNINGWFCPSATNCNANQATLTGIVPKDIRDPYVYNYYLGIQHEVLPNTVLEVDYVGTTGHKLFRAQNINRVPGDRLPVGTCENSNVDGTICGLGHPSLNPNYGTLRHWENVNNSNYNALQTSLRHQFTHGFQFTVNYTYSHSIDNGSTWHSGATSSNSSGAGEGYSLDLYRPGLDRGNSIYDVRNRVVANYVWDLPIFRNSSNGFVKNVLGGWTTNGIWSYQSGAHWEPVCLSGKACDFNLNGVSNDRPDVLANNFDPSHDQWANGWGGLFTWAPTATGNFFTTPCLLPAKVGGFSHLACAGNEGRNTFLGPNFFDADLSLFKNFHITERTSLQFRFETFNSLNRTNFELPGALSTTHNRITSGQFGQAAAAFDPRQLQFGLKLNF